MSVIKRTALAGLLAAAASTATAADRPHPLLPPAPVIEDDTTSGWYLRGDIGYVIPKRPEADFAAGAITGSLVREGMGDTAVAGIGVGYRFSDSFRTDLTVDHRFAARFRGDSAEPALAGGSLMDKGAFQSSTLMVNGYVDVGTVGGFTPYLGAGVGVARNRLSDVGRTSVDAAGLIATDRLAGDTDFSVAWALMAGVGLELSSSLTLDLGYRYISLGDVKTRHYRAGLGTDIESIGAHEVRVGVLYALP